MYLSKARLENWRSYEEGTFTFSKPSARRPLVLIGAMNGHGKTSFLVSLFLGLFGRFGLQYCEGFGKFSKDDLPFYRKAVSLFRRNTAEPEEPTSIELVFSPTLQDSDEKEIRIIRRWFFTSNNQPKQGDSFETVDLYRDAKPEKIVDLDFAADRLEKYLFPPHIMPAFFFDGEQAQTLINNSGAPGIKKAVEIMFGTKVIDEVHGQIQQYLAVRHNRLGGKKQSGQKEKELRGKCEEREELNKRIAHLQKQDMEITEEKEQLEADRREAQEALARLGGDKALDAKRVHEAVTVAQEEKRRTETDITDTIRRLSLLLAISRLAKPIQFRLEAEEVRETWERLREGTIERADEVLAAAMPEPASADELLGHLAPEVRERVKERFRLALAQIYTPPPSRCASEYLLGHVKGEHRQAVMDLLSRARRNSASEIREKARRLREARDQYEELVAKSERLSNLPSQVKDLADRISEDTGRIEEAIRRLTLIENETRKLKADLHVLDKRIGELQEELARMEPDQKRIAVAERVHRVMDELVEKLRPIALKHLQEKVTNHFLTIADRRFSGGEIVFPDSEDGAPIFSWRNEPPQRIDTMSGFERRTFGIAFPLALAEITQKRVPLVIDTPLGNADSEYRPRLLKALTNVDLDQIIILTHDQEVNGEILDSVDRQVSQKFLVSFDPDRKASHVQPDAYFGSMQ